jgi:hypothetical protein
MFWNVYLFFNPGIHVVLVVKRNVLGVRLFKDSSNKQKEKIP